MTVDFTLLDPKFATICTTLIQNCANKGIKIVPVSGLRTLQEQAILWRQSRSTETINVQIAIYRNNDCDYMADLLEGVGPHEGAHVTNALPGYSWHNWGQALDCVVNIGSYSDYANQACLLGLTAGYNFKSFPDIGHVQLSTYEIPSLYTMKEVNDHFQNLVPYSD